MHNNSLYEPCSDKTIDGDVCWRAATKIPHMFKCALCWSHLALRLIAAHAEDAQYMHELEERARERSATYARRGTRLNAHAND